MGVKMLSEKINSVLLNVSVSVHKTIHEQL